MDSIFRKSLHELLDEAIDKKTHFALSVHENSAAADIYIFNKINFMTTSMDVVKVTNDIRCKYVPTKEEQQERKIKELEEQLNRLKSN